MIVVDSSAIIELLLADHPDSDLGTALLSDEMHAPAVIDFEVASGLRGLRRGGKIGTRRAFDAIDDFMSLGLHRYPMTLALREVIALADNFTVYDASYVVLAQALDAPLHTSDTKFAEARRLGVDVHVAGSS